MCYHKAKKNSPLSHIAPYPTFQISHNLVRAQIDVSFRKREKERKKRKEREKEERKNIPCN